MASYDLLQRIRELNRIGIALSAERDALKLLELILTSARRLSDADAGSLYLVKAQQLHFALVQNQQLGIHYGGGGEPISDKFKPLAMYDEQGLPNDNMVAVNCVVSERTIAIADAYATVGYDFSGTRAFDQNTGYRTRSVLAVTAKKS